MFGVVCVCMFGWSVDVCGDLLMYGVVFVESTGWSVCAYLGSLLMFG